MGIIHLVRTQNFPKQLTFLTSRYAHVHVRIKGSEIIAFWENFAGVLIGWSLALFFRNVHRVAEVWMDSFKHILYKTRGAPKMKANPFEGWIYFSILVKDVDNDELFLQNGWSTKGVYALFPSGTMVRNSHHGKSPILRLEDWNLRRIWV